mgnify:CR=1 FL=1
MKILLWLDDVRNPFTFSDWLLQYAPEYHYDKELHSVEWVKNYNEFTNWITINGLPTEIGFDHDLEPDQIIGDIMDIKNCTMEYGKTGMDCARWLTNYCMDEDVELPKWFVQSSNPAGRDNINGILNNFRKHQL